MPVESSLYTWDEHLKIGIQELDEQHRQLVEKMNDMSRCIGEGKGASQLKEILDFISNYSKEHFRTEEGYMERYDYPNLHEQQEHHRGFKKDIKEVMNRVEDEGFTEDIAEKINEYIIRWFLRHLRYEDQKFGEFLKKKQR